LISAKNFSVSYPRKDSGQAGKPLPEAQKSPKNGLQKLKSRHDSMESRHDSIKSRRDSIKSRRDFSFILPLRWFFRGGETPLFWVMRIIGVLSPMTRKSLGPSV